MSINVYGGGEQILPAGLAEHRVVDLCREKRPCRFSGMDSASTMPLKRHGH
jgi:hypothetical protein